MNGDRREPMEKGVDKKEVLKEKGIVYFDVELNPEERIAAQDVRVEREPSEFNYYGPINQELIKGLHDYFSALGKNPDEIINSLSELVARIAKDTTHEFTKEAAWVNIRTSIQSEEHDIPRRWHRDGRYFEAEEKDGLEEKTYKLVYTIRGPSTRFAEKTDAKKFGELEQEAMENYDKYFDSDQERYKKEEIRIREELAKVVQEIDSPTNEQATLYLVGDKEARIHAEPKMNEPRIFLQVLPGSEKQIKQWEAQQQK